MSVDFPMSHRWCDHAVSTIPLGSLPRGVPGVPASLQVVATPRQIQELLDTPLSDCRETRRAGPGEWVMDQ